MIDCHQLFQFLSGRTLLSLALSLLACSNVQASSAQQYGNSGNSSYVNSYGNSPANSYANSGRQPVGLDLQLSELSARVEASLKEASSEKDLLAKRQIEYGNTQLKADIASVPRYYYTSSGKRYENPEYSGIVQSLRDSFERKVSMINEQLARDHIQLNSFYDRRQADLRDSCDSLKSQINSTTGSVQLTSQGTGMYVRNYINYGGVDAQPHYSVPIVTKPQPELTAVAAKLSSLTRSKIQRKRQGF
ncbi:hypothetical protein BH11CYA1_BH11CYA1_11870 [soil metagenome]